MDGHLDRAGPVFCGDPRRHPVLGAGIDADGEGRLVAVGVAVHHQGQIQLIEPLPFHGQADQAPGFGGHEIDLLRGGELSGADQIALVFAILVIHHHDHFAIADRGQTVRDGIEAKRVLGQGLVQGRRALRPSGLTLL